METISRTAEVLPKKSELPTSWQAPSSSTEIVFVSDLRSSREHLSF
jgi:hypothetical protein